MALLTGCRARVGTDRGSPRRHFRRTATLLVSLLVAGLAFFRPCGAAAQNSPSVEFEVKAAYLYNILKFVEWPPGVFSSPNAPLTVCVLGAGPLGAALKGMEGRRLHGHPVALRYLLSLEEIASCHVLVVDAAEPPEVLRGGGGRGLLTVSDREGFARSGGGVNFRMDHSRVRFEINLETARRAGLKISSRLLSLALTVYGK